MILPFSTELNGKPTIFIEKIWEGLLRDIFPTDLEFIEYFDSHKNKFGKSWDELPENLRLENPKIHTIRKDSKDRWEENVAIDFFINTRQPSMFRFAPRLPVKSIQFIGIIHYRDAPEVNIDGRYLFPTEIEILAKNDGFNSSKEFFEYFKEDFHGKIIHWTDFKY